MSSSYSINTETIVWLRKHVIAFGMMKIPFFQGLFNHEIKLFQFINEKIEKYVPSDSACFNLNYMGNIYRCVNEVSFLVEGQWYGLHYKICALHID